MIALLPKHNNIWSSPSQLPSVPALSTHLSFIRQVDIGTNHLENDKFALMSGRSSGDLSNGGCLR
jgi:hypothetical protein